MKEPVVCQTCAHYGEVKGFAAPHKGCIVTNQRISDKNYPNINNDCKAWKEKGES